MILAAAPAQGGFLGSTAGMIMMLAFLFGAMYFMMIRPQKKEQKRVASMLADMKTGDAIVTTSGFYGILIDITDEDVIVEFGNNKNCRIPMRKGAIAEVEKLEDAVETAPPAKNAPAKAIKSESTKDTKGEPTKAVKNAPEKAAKNAPEKTAKNAPAKGDKK